MAATDPGAPPEAVALSPLAGVLLMMATGATDAYVFLVHGHVFAQAMTGNLVLIAVGVVDPTIVPFWHPLTAYLAFVAGVSATWLWRRTSPWLTLILQVLLLAAVGFLPTTFPSLAVVAALAFTSGLQIASYSQVGRASLTATVMTTNSMRTVNAFWTAVLGRRRPNAVREARTYGAALGGFVVGIFVGALAAHLFQGRAAWVISAFFAGVLIAHLSTRVRTTRAPSTPD